MDTVKADLENKALLIPPEAMELGQESSFLLRWANNLHISNEAQNQAAGEELKRIAATRKKIDELFDPIIKDAYQAHKTALQAKKQMTDKLEQADETLRNAMLSYIKEQEQIAQEEQARILAQAGTEPQIVPLVVSNVGKVEGISVRETWKAKIFNPGLVPLEWQGVLLRPIDMAALNKIARMTSGQAKIPGVEFVKEDSLSVRG